MDTKIINRINNLLNKTEENGATSAEALSAYQKAHELLKKNNLTYQDIKVEDQEVINEAISQKTKTPSQHIRRIVIRLAKYFNVETFSRATWEGTKIHIVGRPLDVPLFFDAFKVTIKWYDDGLKSLYKYMDLNGATTEQKYAARASYNNGFVTGMEQTLEESRASTDVILYTPEAVEKYMADLNIKVTYYKVRQTTNHEAFSLGKDQGTNAVKDAI